MLRLPLLATALTLSFSGYADFSADIGLASEYLKDGIGQSRGRLAPQLGLTYLNESGLYAGVWASGIDRKDNRAGSEWNGFGGYYFPISDSLALDLSFSHFTYLEGKNANDQAYNEGTARLLINDAWTLGWRHAEDYQGSGKAKRALESAYTLQTGSFSIEFYLAQNRYLEIDNTTNFGNNRDDYWHLRIGVGRSYNNWDYRLKLERTTLGAKFDAGTNITFSVHRYFDF